MKRVEGRDEDDEEEDEEKGKGKENDFQLTKLKLKRKGLLSFVHQRGGRGGGPTNCATTPVLPWKEEEVKGKGFVFVCGDGGGCGGHQTIIDPTPVSASTPFPIQPLFISPFPPGSARKVGAAVWEFFQYFSPPDTMQFRSDTNHRLRHHQRSPLRHHHYLERADVIGFDHRGNLDAPSRTLPEDHDPATVSSVRHQVAALLAKHHRSAERNRQYPASYGSSVEVTPYHPPRTPTSSVEFKARINGEPSYSFKTSTELLKVLNRIWTLEEQHTSNTSLIKALKIKLDHAHSRIKELLRDQQANRREIDELMKRVSKDKMARKSREENLIESAIQTMRNELEGERKLRMRSEGLHRRLAREIFEVKVTLSTSVKEVEKERRSRSLLEELCDEFANGMKRYERQLHGMKQKSDRSWTGIDEGECLILHMCELWLNERLHMKEAGGGEGQGGDSLRARNESVVDKFRYEIENFLQTRKLGSITPLCDPKQIFRSRRNSLESFPLNEGGSVPRFVGNEDSAFCNSLCSETKLVENGDFDTEKKPTFSARRKGETPLSTHVKLEEEEATADVVASQEQHHQNTIQTFDPESAKITEVPPVDVSSTTTLQQKSEKARVDGEWKDKRDKKSSIDSKPMSELLRSEGSGCGIVNPRKYKNNGKSRMNIASPDLEIAESSSKIVSRGQNALKLKLLEPKTRGGRRSRLKILKGSS